MRIASLCSPRSTSPSASSRFSISPAEARETPSISATRADSVGDAGGGRAVLADREREEVDRLEVLVDGVPVRHRVSNLSRSSCKVPLTCRPATSSFSARSPARRSSSGCRSPGCANPSTGLKAFLTSMATGILLFLFWDVLSNGVEPVEEALRATLVRLRLRLQRAPPRRLRARLHGPDRLRALDARPPAPDAARPGRRVGGRSSRRVYPMGLTPARFLAVLIATGIGLHNFAEGLAIGQSAAEREARSSRSRSSSASASTTRPRASASSRRSRASASVPSWRFLLLARPDRRRPDVRRHGRRPGVGEHRPCRSCSSASRPARSSTS